MSSEASVEDRWLGHIEGLRALLQDPTTRDEHFLLEAQGHLQELSDQAESIWLDLEEPGGGVVGSEEPAAEVRVTAAAVLALSPDDSLDAVMEWFELLLGKETHPFAQAVVETWVAADNNDKDGGGTD